MFSIIAGEGTKARVCTPPAMGIISRYTAAITIRRKKNERL
jgi:hypothetical protein